MSLTGDDLPSTVKRRVAALILLPSHAPTISMSGFDLNRTYSVSVHDQPPPSAPESASESERLLLDFLLQYRVGGEFLYRFISTPAMLT